MGNMRPFIIAIAFGLIAVALVYLYVQQVEQKANETEIQMTKVVRAVIDIPPRTTIQEHMIEEIEVPADIVTADNVTELDDILGQVSVTGIYENQLLMNQMFTEETTLEDLSRMLQEGERAVTVGVTEVSGLGGNLKPGDNVDVLVTILSNEEVGVPSTFTVLRNISIMAVGQDIGFDQNEAVEGGSVSKSVTLRVNPFQAEQLSLASEVGSLRLSLRDPDDDYAPATNGTALTEFVKYTPTRQDLQEAADREFQRQQAEAAAAAAEREAWAQAYAASAAQNTAPANYQQYTSLSPLEELGPPPILVEVILGGQSQIVSLEPEEEQE